ncbi:hypothetical protein T484DRAFT_1946432 [Baffinella frigidus]|nr:hypothetical protein T484DRAFT_1946432 [Cryptophyta sp. CCMP2293]|mmetsp:Transcript_27722/g.66011  ORF Transcript_27722/g.66011 Transcript_27722/m.66011 type:complete len:247 (+) Transcript_27722:46-786(+)
MANGEAAPLLPHRSRRSWGLLARGAGAVALVALAGALVAGWVRRPAVRLSAERESNEVGAAIVNSLFGKQRRIQNLHVWKPNKLERGGVNVDTVGGFDVASLIGARVGDYQAGHNVAPAGPLLAGGSNETSSASNETSGASNETSATKAAATKAAWWRPAVSTTNATAPANATAGEESGPEFSSPTKMEWTYGGLTRELGTRPHYTRSLPGVNVNGNLMCGTAPDGRPLDCDTNAWESDEGEKFDW